MKYQTCISQISIWRKPQTKEALPGLFSQVVRRDITKSREVSVPRDWMLFTWAYPCDQQSPVRVNKANNDDTWRLLLLLVPIVVLL